MEMRPARKLMLFGALTLTLVLRSFGRTHEDLNLKTLPPPEVQSPYYLIELANYEYLLFNALQNFDQDSRQANRPQLPIKIAGVLNKINRLTPELTKKWSDLLHSNRPQQLTIEIAEALNNYFQSFLDDMLAVKAYSNYNLTGVSGREIAHNPILSLKMVWRFVFELQAVHSAFLKFGDSVPAGPVIKTYFSSKKVVSTWPTEITVDECIVALLRIQMVYDLDAKDLAYGNIMGIDTGAKLSMGQLLRIGVFAHKTKQYTLAISWLELMIEKLNTEKQPLNIIEEIGKQNIQDYLTGVYADHDRSWDTKQNWEYFYFSRKLHENGNLLNPSDRVPLRKLNCSTDFRKKRIYNECSFWSLCSGENHQTEIEKSELHCWYETNSHPMLILAPVKIELLSKYPRIIQMYDMINEAMIIKLTTLAEPNLERSHVIFDVKADVPDFESVIRSSVEGWIQGQYEDIYLSGLTRRIESITGLHVAGRLTSEPYVVALYAFGGHFDCHLDGFKYDDKLTDNGNRLATIMFYLSNTLKGGFTAFPQAGFAVRPIKGSAIFWYNLKPNGERDINTYHCACPVILGHKIISTKWIKSYVQNLKTRCGLLKDE